MVLVFVDLPSGGLDDPGKGILAEARRLAATLGTPWAAACLAGAPEAAYEAMKPYGVPEVLELRAPAGAADAPSLQAEALAAAARHAGATAVLLAHSDLGATLAPVVAARLGAALFTEAISFSRDWAGLTVRRQAIGAQVVDQRLWTDAASGNGDSAYGARGAASRVVLDAAVPASGARACVTERIPPDPETMDLTEAPVIFTAGLGCNRESFDRLCELAALVGASVGVTRPVYDLGWRGFDRMVGQTGKTVVPRLYLTFGISGSMHHVGGISESKRIVCINVDPKAPIFPNADEGFVADVREVLPRLLERVRGERR